MRAAVLLVAALSTGCGTVERNLRMAIEIEWYEKYREHIEAQAADQADECEYSSGENKD